MSAPSPTNLDYVFQVLQASPSLRIDYGPWLAELPGMDSDISVVMHLAGGQLNWTAQPAMRLNEAQTRLALRICCNYGSALREIRLRLHGLRVNEEGALRAKVRSQIIAQPFVQPCIHRMSVVHFLDRLGLLLDPPL